MAINTAAELAAACRDVARNHKTLCIMGCFGAPMNAANKVRYTRNHCYNRRISHTAVDFSYIAGYYTIGIGGAYMDFANGVWPQTRR